MTNNSFVAEVTFKFEYYACHTHVVEMWLNKSFTQKPPQVF